MIKESLQKLLEVKADIKSALTAAGIEDVSDVFSTYPGLIRSLLQDEYADFFVPTDEYIETHRQIGDDFYLVKSEKWLYRYDKSISVEGPEISRTQIEIPVILDVKTSDGSEITINYGDGKSVTSIGGVIKGFLQGEKFNSITNWDKVIEVNYICTDYLPGEAKDYTFGKLGKEPGYSASSSAYNMVLTKIHNWVALNATNLDGLFYNCRYLTEVNMTVSSRLTSMMKLCQCKSSMPLIKLSIKGCSGCMNFHSLIHSDSSTVLEEIEVDFSSANDFNHILCRSNARIWRLSGKFSNNIVDWTNWNYNSSKNTQSMVEEIYGLDVSKITDPANFLFLSNSISSGWYPNLTKCKVEGLGVGCQIIDTRLYPHSSVWDEEDIIYTFTNIAPTSNPEASINLSTRVSQVFKNNPELAQSVENKGYKLTYH